ncbi:MAG: hypothetical protein IJ681_00040 [Bacteroidales bacterium]|nr:hypothetical protein [Bacteroidales bacterium]
MTLYAKFINENQIKYAPTNKGSIFNYDLDIEAMTNDGYKPVIQAERPDNDRNYFITYAESNENITEIITYLETEKEYQNRKNNENIQLDIDLLNSQIRDIDLKRIRAICEPSIKDETTGETWLHYYNSQILDLRNQIQILQERITPNDITQQNLSPLDSRES